jgi:hypothetical protein
MIENIIQGPFTLLLLHLSLASLLLVLRTRTVSRHGTLEFGSFSNTFTLLAHPWLLGDLRAMVSVAIGKTLLLSRHVVEAPGLSTRIGLLVLSIGNKRGENKFFERTGSATSGDIAPGFMAFDESFGEWPLRPIS